MNKTEERLILNFALNKIDETVFNKNFSKVYLKRYIVKNLEDGLINKDSNQIEIVLLLYFKKANIIFDKNQTLLLCNLIVQDWHNEHEDLATILHEIKDPVSIPFLVKAMHLNLEYLEYNDGESLIRKCAYALADINTIESLEKIKYLSESENSIIKTSAIEQLKRKRTNLPQ